MIFVKSTLQAIGQDCLIFNQNALDFYRGTVLEKEEFSRLFSILKSGEPLNIPSGLRKNLLLVVLYNEYETNPEAKMIYERDFKENFISKEDSALDSLHIIFNIIEFEVKYPRRNRSELQILFNSLMQYMKLKKIIEDFLLFKYYSGVLSFFLNKLKDTNNYTMDIIVDMNEQFEIKKLRKSEFIKFIQIKNSLLRIKTLEQEDPIQNRQDIISHLECLLELTKLQKEDFAIRLGLKIYNLQAESVDYKNCIKTLEELMKILHKEMLYGKSHKNLVEQLLFISGLLGYHNSLVGNINEVKRFTKKINKHLSFLKENSSSKNNSQSTIIPQYDFYNIILQSICKAPTNPSMRNSIQNYQGLLGNSIKEQDEALLNIYLLNNSDMNASQMFAQKATDYYQKILRNTKINDEHLFTIYLFLYNYLSSMSNKLSRNNLKDVRKCSKDIIDYTINLVNTNQYLKELFQLFYFKEMFNRIYFVYVYSFYFEGDYERAIRECDTYNDLIKNQFELNLNKQSYANIIKIKGDALYKLQQFNDALQLYSNIVNLLENKIDTVFNMALCNIFLKKVNTAKELLNKIRDDINKIPEKKKVLDVIISKIGEL